MTIMLPGDPRALRNTGRTWRDKHGDEQPIMRDGFGRTYFVTKFTVADFDEGGDGDDMLSDLAARLEEEMVRE